jgi:hypothetical protein
MEFSVRAAELTTLLGCLSETIYLVQSIKSFSKVSSRCVYGILLEQVGLGS